MPYFWNAPGPVRPGMGPEPAGWTAHASLTPRGRRAEALVRVREAMVVMRRDVKCMVVDVVVASL